MHSYIRVNTLEIGFYIAISLVTFLALGPLIIGFSADHLNPDTYLYISIANYYVFESPTKVIDAFTVGPVIPILIATIKYALMDFVVWDANTDIILVKILSITCCIAIFVMSAAHMRRQLPGKSVSIFILLLLALLPVNLDTVGLNGELVSVCFFLILVLTFRISSDILWVFFVSLVSFLILNTKMQSVIFLVMLLFWGTYKNGTFDILKLVSVAFIICVLDLILYFFDLGFIYRLLDMLTYTGIGSSDSAGDLSVVLFSIVDHYMSGLMWAINSIVINTPLLAFIVIYSLFTPKSTEGMILIQHPILWLLVLLVTMITPGKNFEHYSVYAIFYTVFMAPIVLVDIGSRVTSDLSKMIIPSLLLIIIYNVAPSVFGTDSAEGRKKIFPSEKLSGQIPELLNIVSSTPGKLLVHGWDYRYYSIFSRGSFGMELPLVVSGIVPEERYFDSIDDENYRYIVDVVQASGLIGGIEHSLSHTTSYGQRILRDYQVIGAQNGVVLYEKKAYLSGVSFRLPEQEQKQPPFTLHEQSPFTLHEQEKLLSVDDVLQNSNWHGADYQRTEINGYAVLGSYVGADSDTGFIDLDMKSGFGFYYRSGPVPINQTLTLTLSTGEEKRYVLPSSIDWTLLVFDDVQLSERFRLRISDAGSRWGEWSAIALSYNE
jgi:hypothetical protein